MPMTSAPLIPLLMQGGANCQNTLLVVGKCISHLVSQQMSVTGYIRPWAIATANLARNTVAAHLKKKRPKMYLRLCHLIRMIATIQKIQRQKNFHLLGRNLECAQPKILACQSIVCWTWKATAEGTMNIRREDSGQLLRTVTLTEFRLAKSPFFILILRPSLPYPTYLTYPTLSCPTYFTYLNDLSD